MPFTPSHAAAVLPLLRTPLPASALVVGSVTPDIPYYLPGDPGVFTHTATAVVTTDLALGGLAWAVWHAVLAAPALAAAPAGLRVRLSDVPLGLRRRVSSGSAVALTALALVVGAGIHVLWDEFTHATRWGAENIPALQEVYGPLHGWAWAQQASGVLGAVALLVWFVRWWRRTPRARPGLPAGGVVGLGDRDRRGTVRRGRRGAGRATTGLGGVPGRHLGRRCSGRSGPAPGRRMASPAAAHRLTGAPCPAGRPWDRRRDRRLPWRRTKAPATEETAIDDLWSTGRLRPAGRRRPVDVEQELARALSRYEWVLSHVADGIYGLDADGRVEFANPSAARITGWSEEQLLGRDQHQLLHGRRPDGSPYPRHECPVWTALQTGRTVVADDELFWRRDGAGVPVELIAVPTVEDGAVTGVVVSFRDLTDHRAAERQAADLARLAVEAQEQRALSERLQRALLTPPPEPDHLHIAVRYQPAGDQALVGGDWYDAFLQPDGATMLAIGDVVGHGSDAAAAMGQLRGLLRALAYDNDEPLSATLTRMEHAARGLDVAGLATALLARVERHPDVPVSGRRVLRWSSAGHLPPVLLAADGTTTVLETPPDLMLGVDPDAPRRDHTAELDDGCTLLLVTDGLVERRDSDLDAGMAALRAALADLGSTPLEELCDAVLARLVPGHEDDDVALVAVRAHPEDRPRPPEAGPNRLPPGVD